VEQRAGIASNYRLTSLLAGSCCAIWSFAAPAQSLSDDISVLSGSASVFTAVTHTRTDQGTYTDTNTEPGVGLSGVVGGTLERGANALTLQYGGTVDTSWESADSDQSDNSTITGAALYTHQDPGSRLDFNLGHTVNSVRNDTGFVVNPSSYDVQNNLSGGAGLRFYPGELTTLRFSGQAGRSFGEDTLNDQKSVTASSQLSRRLTERSTGSLNASRSWSEERRTDITIDTVQLVYSYEAEGGFFSIGGGGSKANSEYPDGTVSENEAITGFLERSWVTSDWRTAIAYDRSMSDSATDLSTGLPPEFSFLPDTVRLRELVVTDSLLFTHNNQRICDVCDLGIYAEGSILESQVSGATTHEYRAGTTLGVQLTALQRLTFGYSWEADADEDANIIVEQLHRFTTSWSRQLAENTTFGVQLDQSYLRSRLARSDEEQFELRFVLTHGFAMSRQR